MASGACASAWRNHGGAGDEASVWREYAPLIFIALIAHRARRGGVSRLAFRYRHRIAANAGGSTVRNGARRRLRAAGKCAASIAA